MKIKSVYIKRGLEERKVEFTEKMNLIYSKENSKGKTTLLRLILYGFGYNIPATDGIKTFDDFYIKIEYKNNDKDYVLERNDKFINYYLDNKTITYVVPEQINELHSMIFGIADPMILNNLLAIYYIDQEKGWTLLNRGNIIGKNRFNIEDFIAALSDKSITSINYELDSVRKEINKYKYLKSTVEYKKEVVADNTFSYNKKEDLELYKQKKLLELEEKEIKKDIIEINEIIDDNKKLIKYLEKLDIYIVISENKSIKVTEKNIENNSENNMYYNARKKELELKLAKVKKELSKIETEINSRNLLFNVKTVADEVNDMLENINIDERQVDKILDQLNKRKESLTRQLHGIIKNNNKYLESIFETIRDYSKELGIEKYIKDDYEFVLTNKLKGKSGKILTQTSFIFKIAYLKEIRRKYNIVLPIIIDSPRTNELTDEASTAMMKILERDYKEHQIIFASVYKFEKINKHIIEMKDNLFY